MIVTGLHGRAVASVRRGLGRAAGGGGRRPHDRDRQHRRRPRVAAPRPTCSTGPSRGRSSPSSSWPTAATSGCCARPTPSPPTQPARDRRGSRSRATRDDLTYAAVPDLARASCAASRRGGPSPTARRPRPACAGRRGSTGWSAAVTRAASSTSRRAGSAWRAAPSTRWTRCGWPTCRPRSPRSPSTGWRTRLSPPVVAAVIDFDGGGRFQCELTDVDPTAVRHRRPRRDDVPPALHAGRRPQLLLEGPADQVRRMRPARPVDKEA